MAMPRETIPLPFRWFLYYKFSLAGFEIPDLDDELAQLADDTTYSLLFTKLEFWHKFLNNYYEKIPQSMLPGLLKTMNVESKNTQVLLWNLMQRVRSKQSINAEEFTELQKIYSYFFSHKEVSPEVLDDAAVLACACNEAGFPEALQDAHPLVPRLSNVAQEYILEHMSKSPNSV
jgi:hypothetical protein